MEGAVEGRTDGEAGVRRLPHGLSEPTAARADLRQVGRADPGGARQRRTVAEERPSRRAAVAALLRAVPPAGRGQPEDAHPDPALPRARRPAHPHRDTDRAGHGHLRADRPRALAPEGHAAASRAGPRPTWTTCWPTATTTTTAPPPMEEQDRRSELMSALSTEHFVLQTATSTSVSESASRASLYVMSLSSVLVATGFVAQTSEAFGPFVATVLPGVFVLGVFTFLRLVDNATENLQFLVGIARIRGYYRSLSPEAATYFPAEGGRWPEPTVAGEAPRTTATPLHVCEHDRRRQQHGRRSRRGSAGERVADQTATTSWWCSPGVVVAACAHRRRHTRSNAGATASSRASKSPDYDTRPD